MIQVREFVEFLEINLIKKAQWNSSKPFQQITCSHHPPPWFVSAKSLRPTSSKCYNHKMKLRLLGKFHYYSFIKQWIMNKMTAKRMLNKISCCVHLIVQLKHQTSGKICCILFFVLIFMVFLEQQIEAISVI